MDTFPLLETGLLRLRKPVVKDIPQIVEYAQNPRIAETTLNIPHPYREKDAVFWLNRASEGFENQSHIIFAIGLLPADEFIGGIGLRINKRFNRAEMGFWIGEPFWNNGYATEAISEALRFGFEEVGLNKIYGTHFLSNPASGKVMAKNGMIKEAKLVEHVKKGDHYLSLIQYRLTQKEFDRKKGAVHGNI